VFPRYWYLDYTKTQDKRKIGKKNIHHQVLGPAYKGEQRLARRTTARQANNGSPEHKGPCFHSLFPLCAPFVWPAAFVVNFLTMRLSQNFGFRKAVLDFRRKKRVFAAFSKATRVLGMALLLVSIISLLACVLAGRDAGGLYS
jgi:hypothetical protein